ncbi:hypothetical protein BGZ72_003858, partial [Mortierella alpina]
MLGWGKGDLVSQAIVETANVPHITLQILQAEVSKPKKSSDREGPVLQFKVAKILNSKLVTFYIPEDYPEDSGRLTVKIQVPYGFDGSLIVEGSFLDIRGMRTRSLLERQQQARFSELSLTTDEGSIDLRGTHTRAAVFKAVVKRLGDVHTGTLEEAVRGGGLEAIVKSAVGLVALDTRMTYSMEATESTGGYHIKAVAGQGRIQLHVQEGEAVGGRRERGVRPGVLRIEAESEGGDVDATVELMDGQELRLDAKSTEGAIVKL